MRSDYIGAPKLAGDACIRTDKAIGRERGEKRMKKDIKNVLYIIMGWFMFSVALLIATLVFAPFVGWGSKAMGFYVDDRFNIMISAFINLVIFRAATSSTALTK